MYFGDRKKGCRFYEFTFYGFRSLLIENNCIRTVMLLDKGTDIISFDGITFGQLNAFIKKEECKRNMVHKNMN